MADKQFEGFELKVESKGLTTTAEVAAVIADVIKKTGSAFMEVARQIVAVQKAVDDGDKALNARVDGVEIAITRERKEIDAAIRSISLTPGDPGKDADPEDVKRRVLAEIVLPEPDQLAQLTDIEIRDMLEALPQGHRFRAQFIEGLKDVIEALIPKDGGKTWVGGRAGLQTTVNGKKVGLVQYIDYEAGTDITIVPVFKNGVLTLTVNSTGGSAASWHNGEQITLGGDNASFTLANAPTATLEVLLDRQPQILGLDITGTINGTNKNFAFTSAVDPSLASLIYANYL